jgi:adenosylmethionine-8-amino-7-oxononanoate aminotransferase
MFGSDHYGMEPNLITIAKGLTSAYAPLSGIIISEKLWPILEQGVRRIRRHWPWLDLFRSSALRSGRRRQS